MQQETGGDPRLDITPRIDFVIRIAYLRAVSLLHGKFKVAFVIELMETIIIASVFQNIIDQHRCRDTHTHKTINLIGFLRHYLLWWKKIQDVNTSVPSQQLSFFFIRFV
jgi:hypothetical protein